MGQRWLDGYSADIELYLLVSGERYEVAQVGGGSLILRGETRIKAQTPATLVIKIDGEEERQDILICEDVRYDQPVSFF